MIEKEEPRESSDPIDERLIGKSVRLKGTAAPIMLVYDVMNGDAYCLWDFNGRSQVRWFHIYRLEIIA